MKSHLFGAAFLALTALLMPAERLDAAVVYQYTGNNYTSFLPSVGNVFNTSMSVNGSFTVASLLINVNEDIRSQVSSFSFMDGLNTITEANFIGGFQVTTNSAGNITDWSIDISNVNPLSSSIIPGDIFTRIITRNVSDEAFILECDFIVGSICVFKAVAQATAFRNPGDWSAVPIPSALYLFGSGLLGLLGFMRRFRSAS